AEASRRLREHIEHRATIANVREQLETGGFEIARVVERESVMRFASGSALLNHYFIKLGFLDAWKKIVTGNERDVFARLRSKLDEHGELRLSIPMAYVEATAA
ncbi:MAG: hypothetical protein JO093_24120, partial [Acidobacteria bacterium]|nr:hypothetical protein [Acidobacteriota bacterium]